MRQLAICVPPRNLPRERGAVAVEFALVVPVLLLLVFGFIDYGAYYSDVVGVRQGAREAARQGSVASWGAACSPSGASGSAHVQALMCQARTAAMTAGTGTVQAKVRFVDCALGPCTDAPYPAKADIDSGNSTASIRICLSATHASLTHYVPFPADGVITTKVDFRIENVPAAGTETAGTTSASTDWSWC